MKNTEEQGYAPRTDLACERMKADTALPGAQYTEEEREGFCISRLRITDAEAAASIGKPEGNYLTLSHPPFWQMTEAELTSLTEVLADCLSEICGGAVPEASSVLVAGLGNRYITADAIGPETVRQVFATRHLKREDPGLFDRFATTELALLAPGVMAQTGIETEAVIEAVKEKISPALIIAVDALAARSFSRLGATVQLSDTGIRPGSGIGNARSALDRESLGIPVIGIGIPTVVDSATLVLDVLEKGGLTEIPDGVREVLESGDSFFVTPREGDVVTERASTLLADALNRTFSRGFFVAE